MSVVNEIEAQVVKLSETERKVYIISDEGYRGVFAYDFNCRTKVLDRVILVCFDIKKERMLIVMAARISGGYVCAVMRFWIANNLPVPAARWMTDQDTILAQIADDFQDKYAMVLLDDVING